ncbi:MAG: sigma-54-dependent Fis family transcriptional regulator [Deltaproteobacteria bacterium]|nr:sigma-54-dependent Fis family transcriptional regulator [Deltaproteobacteria bacterium]
MSAADHDRPRILVVDDEDGIRTTLDVLFRRAGWDVALAVDGGKALDAIRSSPPYDLVVTDLVMPVTDGIEVLRAARERSADTQVIVITAHATVETALAAMRLGAHDYVQKPYAMEELRVRAERAIEKRRLIDENTRLRARVAGRRSFGEIIAASDRMAAVIGVCRRAAQIPTNVLVTGESGTGKELVARAIHHEGTRAGKPFVVVDCGSIPETLIESELFGHMRGAFTGALAAQPGLFRSADGGTVFLDEIAELPLGMQVKLLRVLQERVVKPVGGVEEIAVDVRVVAATNRDLEAEVRAGRFREDLFYRLNVLRIEMPPLRERLADIKPLAEQFLHKYGEQLGRKMTGFTEAAFQRLLAHDFPGNVRELANVIERAVAMSDGAQVDADAVRLGRSATSGPPDAPVLTREPGMSLDDFMDGVERRVLVQAVAEVGSKHRDLAHYLGITERSLRYRLGKHRIGQAEEGSEATKIGARD